MSTHDARHRAEPTRRDAGDRQARGRHRAAGEGATAVAPGAGRLTDTSGVVTSSLARHGRRVAGVAVAGALATAASVGVAAPAQAHWLVSGDGSTTGGTTTTAVPAQEGTWPVPASAVKVTLQTTNGPVTTWRTPTAAVATGNAAALRNAIIATARTGLGHRYVWGGTSPVTGWDCGGYVSWVLRQHGFDLPVLGGDAMATALGAQQIPFSEGRPGDIIWIPGQHIGIYDGNGGVFEALNPVQGTMHNPVHGGILLRLPVRDS